MVVVGAGMAGLATARALARDGRSVVVFEQFRLGHARGSSHGTSRIFRLAHDDPHDVRNAQRALALWRELETEARTPLLQITGDVQLGDDLSPYENSLSACSVPYELADADRLERAFGIRTGGSLLGLYQPDGGIVLAERALAALAASARAHGTRIVEETAVRTVASDGAGVTVGTSRGSYAADAVVVTAGAWSKGLLETIGIAAPLLATRQTIAYFRVHTGVAFPTLVEGVRGECLRYALQAPELGVKAAVETANRTDPDEPGVPDGDALAAAVRWAIERLPIVDTPPACVETCLYTSTDDERFVLERHGRVVVGSACSGRGFKFAPLTGRLLADLAAEVL
ncbi:MAG: FAD-dependent oxidoreductase [Gaiellaceae bacterium]